MARSAWKLPFISKNLSLNSIKSLRQISKTIIENKNKKKNIKIIKNVVFFKPFIVSRSQIVPNSLIGFKVKIYNGKLYKNLFIKQKMLGHKFGEFSFTKVMGSLIAARKREKQQKLLKKGKKK